MFRVGDPTGLQFHLSLDGCNRDERADASTFGRLAVWLGDDLVWGKLDENGDVVGVEWYWIELLEQLATNWRYLRYESGYPFGSMPFKPSGMSYALQRRWSQPGIDEAAEDEVVFGFRNSHNLAWALNGCVVPDLWFVREGQVALIECKGRVKRCSHERELQTLESLAEFLCKAISNLSDPRSMLACGAWDERNQLTFDDAIELMTAESEERLSDIAAGSSYEEVFADPLSSDFDSNRTIDLVFRCKGLAPAKSLRKLIGQIPRQQAKPNPLLEDLSSRLRTELSSWIEADWPPYKQGQKLAWVLRHDADLFSDRCGRADPEALLQRLGAQIDRWPLDARALDAIAVWGHGVAPWIVLNDHEKHAANIGAERATIAHELCHLLVDRSDVLPFGAVVGGVMDRNAEQRANAFAAELLCPRFYLRQVFDQLLSADIVIDEVTKRFGVSRELAALQLARADCQLPATDQREIEKHVSPDASLPWR